MQSGSLQPGQLPNWDSFTATSDRRTDGQKAGMLDESFALTQYYGDIITDWWQATWCGVRGIC